VRFIGGLDGSVLSGARVEQDNMAAERQQWLQSGSTLFYLQTELLHQPAPLLFFLTCPLVPAKAGTQRWIPAFRLRAPRYGGLKPAEAREASVGWVAGMSGDWIGLTQL
jgi:hypothetical protein